MLRCRALSVLALVCVFAGSPCHLPAQTASTALSGKITDPTGARVARARITAIREGEREPTTSGSTDENGTFSLALPAGRYTVVVSAAGFLESSQSVSIPAVGLVHDFQLQIAPVSNTVTVVENTDYLAPATATATKTLTPLIDVPQAVTVVTKEFIADQMMTSIADVVRYVPGISSHQGENNRDQVVIRGNSTSADFFVDGVRDDVQYYRDLYNVERVEALKGPNAMIFGRGGAGGLINRVTKEAGFTPLREVTLEGGSFSNKRFATDFDRAFGHRLAFRVNGVYENSDSFRRFVSLERYGINPTVSFVPGQDTRITFSYENFHDRRTADRGIPSFDGLPADLPVSTFFGDPENSRVRAAVDLGSVSVEHHVHDLTIRNHTTFGNYDRGYQNYVPGAVTPDKTQVALSAYNNATQRLNIFNQTDLTYTLYTGHLRHTLLGGTELGRQSTSNFRNTGYFNNTDTSLLVPYSQPVIDTPITFRQSATDADNHINTHLGATYIQDQVEIFRYLQFVGGIRFDYFDLQYHNNRNADELRRIDRLISPRAGVVFKPRPNVSIYGTYSISYLPSSGDQFSSLTVITQQLKPEKFNNYEVGAKWDLARSLSLTAALYRLNRTNTRSIDPNDPTRILQTGSTRSNGLELGATGSITRKWQIAGGYAFQNAYVTSATASAIDGAVLAQVPRHSFSLWNNYRIHRRVGVGLGLLNRSDMFAAIDDKVTLPGYTRADAAVFLSLTEKVRLQANAENLFDTRYYVNADGNNNISPGSSRAVRAALTARF